MSMFSDYTTGYCQKHHTTICIDDGGCDACAEEARDEADDDNDETENELKKEV